MRTNSHGHETDHYAGYWTPKFSHDLIAKNIYAGIGSREIPENVRLLMWDIGRFLARSGWTLRSGGATGSDTAFEQGCDVLEGPKEIFLPWEGYRRPLGQRPHEYYPPTNEGLLMAAMFHPAWGRCSTIAKKLHGRNSHIIMGYGLDSPVDLVICWTKDGQATGGTGQGLRIAKKQGIPIDNLFYAPVFDSWRRRIDGQRIA